MTKRTDLPSNSLSLGLAQWATSQWQGAFFSSGSSQLAQYSKVFSSVEGNTTFYALPSEANIERWKTETEESFEFCCKFPQVATHRGSLDPNHPDLIGFFKRIQPLENKIGPFMVQLPSQFGKSNLPTLAHFLDGLPSCFHYSLEVRNPIFFQKGETERQLNCLLAERSIDRTSLDSRALFSAPANTEAMIDAQRKKPRLPVHAIATGQRPMVRFIGRMEAEQNTIYWQPWLKKISRWLQEGKRPIVFIHTPDNLQAPEHARLFHQQLSKHIALPELPKFTAANTTQEDLFG